MSQTTSTPKANVYNKGTDRKDTWWLEPLLIATGFTLFIIYATYRVFENNFYEANQYLSPFYSPKLMFDWWKWSPAILILWMPAGFRATCYYYRKAYYRSYFLTPAACTVKPMTGGYCGETKFPFVLQNMHRYFFYLAVLVICFLWYDAAISFFSPSGNPMTGKFTVSVLSLVMVLNCVLLSGYTFGCHAYRHLCGGSANCFSNSSGEAKSKYKVWQFVTKLNEHHMGWAWASLFSVAFTDFFIRQVASGAWNPMVLF